MKTLTKQESKIAHLVAKGFAEKEIGDQMCISPHTVHAHTRNIRNKWNARNIADITRIYILSLENPRKALAAVMFVLDIK